MLYRITRGVGIFVRSWRWVLSIFCFLGLLVLATTENPVRAQVNVHFGIILGRDFLNLSEPNRRLYASGFTDALLLAPLLQNTLAIKGVISCFNGMTDEQVAAIMTKQIASHPEMWHIGVNVQAFNVLLKVCPEFLPGR